MSAHTPGPWTALIAPKGNFRPQQVVLESEGKPFARLWQAYTLPGYQANALLIAAAPEEHKALKRLVDAVEVFAGSEPDMPSHADTEAELEAALVEACAAYAKAEGRDA